MNKKLGILVVATISLYITSAELIEGDKDASEGTTFSFSVNKNFFSGNGSFYEAANETLTANQEFTLSRLMRGTKAFVPLTPETVSLNGSETSNPLFGPKIIALGMLETEDGLFTRDMPIVVNENRPATVYLFENATNPAKIELRSSDDVHDAQGHVSSGIINLATDYAAHIFAAAKPNTGEFGDLNSGIALLIRGIIEKSPESGSPSFRIFSELNATTGSPLKPEALLLDPRSPEIAIENDLANIVKNTITMHWDTSLKRLFIGLQTTSNSGINDGCRAVVACKFIENGAIELQTIAPNEVFETGTTTNIIGARGANQQVSIHAINSMYTSTALNYLIVLGNVGDPDSTKQSVFALPLVNTGDSAGTIAQKNAQPQNVFRDAQLQRLTARTIDAPAKTPDEMTQSTDLAAQVGGGQLTAGPIINIIIRDDTVFAFVGENDKGVYSSQAIFDAAGKITSWTRWQRAAGTTDAIFGAALNPYEGNFILASGTTADTVNTIKKTIWSDGAENSLQPLTNILNTALPSNKGGVQGMHNFLPQTPGLHNIAVLAAGGTETVVLAQTGLLNGNNIIIPTTGSDYNQLVEFTDGTITANVMAKTVIISGGVLNTLGPIATLELAQNTTNGWLFVGGSNGLAVLAEADGSGWNPATSLGDNFSGLVAGMSFKKIGKYSFIRKLIYDSGFLFVISDQSVDRINLTTSDFGTGTLDVTTIASIGQNGVSTRGGFLDGIFSQACAILATTDMMLRIGDNKDIRTITSEADAQWQEVIIPENAGAPIALYTVSATNRAQDITKNNGGHFYVLTANAGLDQSRINRFAVQKLAANESMKATTVTAFDDLFIKNIPSFLLSFGALRSNFSTDGALYFATRNQDSAIAPVVTITPGYLVPRVGVPNVGDKSSLVPVEIQGTEINYFSRSAASGSWIAAGNFDTQVLE